MTEIPAGVAAMLACDDRELVMVAMSLYNDALKLRAEADRLRAEADRCVERHDLLMHHVDRRKALLEHARTEIEGDVGVMRPALLH